MSGNQAPDLPAQPPRIDEADMLDYLRVHPELLTRDPQLLAGLKIPHASGGAVSLIERQVETLRADNTDLRQQLQDLLAMARENDQLNQRLHRLTLDLIDAVDFDEVLTMLEDHLHEHFRADAVELRLFSATHLRGEHDTGPEDPELETFIDFFDAGHPICGPLGQRPLDAMFGSEAEDIGSAALIPLRDDDIMGVLAVGSSDKRRFHPEMGTEFLVRLAEVVSRKLQAVSLPGV